MLCVCVWVCVVNNIHWELLHQGHSFSVSCVRSGGDQPPSPPLSFHPALILRLCCHLFLLPSVMQSLISPLYKAVLIGLFIFVILLILYVILWYICRDIDCEHGIWAGTWTWSAQYGRREEALKNNLMKKFPCGKEKTGNNSKQQKKQQHGIKSELAVITLGTSVLSGTPGSSFIRKILKYCVIIAFFFASLPARKSEIFFSIIFFYVNIKF